MLPATGNTKELCDRRGAKEKRKQRRINGKGLGIYLARIYQSRYIEDSRQKTAYKKTEERQKATKWNNGRLECWKTRG